MKFPFRSLHRSTPIPARFAATTLLAILVACGFSGCGTNQFQQELETEEASLKLARETETGDYRLVGTRELKRWLDADEPIVLIDAMPADSSYDLGHFPGAVNFLFPKDPIDTWDATQMDGKSLEDYAAVLGPDKNRKIVVYCGFVKCARSHNAALFARRLGFTNVYRHPGGIHAWRGAGYPLSTD